ncbi:hypothetical protein BAL199_27081 [alpha proteobacterium BAL199]|jgi:uncharacterized protein|nr:hypothetical protein BAL199_27081 [alpha proteobacterium BAL199]
MVRWRGRESSQNVEDRRAASGGGRSLPMLLLRLVFTRFGIVGVAALAGGYFALQAVGIDPMLLLAPQSEQQQRPQSSASNEQFAFASIILAETETVWEALFAASGGRYPPPTLVVFSGQVHSDCGAASSASGPFYCPADQKIYLDTTFFGELAQRFRAPGDFAAAYVIAHEVGHHVQDLVGTLSDVHQRQAGLGPAAINALQVQVELQADCYAGLWAHHAERTAGLLEEGDIAEGMAAAAAIGDDRLQRNSGRRVDPESFTHGTSQQRQRWFLRGYRSGETGACDTFAGPL